MASVTFWTPVSIASVIESRAPAPIARPSSSPNAIAARLSAKMAGVAPTRLSSTISRLTATEKAITTTRMTKAVGRSQRAMRAARSGTKRLTSMPATIGSTVIRTSCRIIAGDRQGRHLAAAAAEEPGHRPAQQRAGW